MAATLHVETKILPGRRVEVPTPELPEGETVTVFVVPNAPLPTPSGLNTQSDFVLPPPSPDPYPPRLPMTPEQIEAARKAVWENLGVFAGGTASSQDILRDRWEEVEREMEADRRHREEQEALRRQGT